MNVPASTRYLIIGAGVHGLSTAYHLAREHSSMENRVHLLPKAIDDEVARTKLDAVGMGVDALTPEQEEFLAGWRDVIEYVG